MILAFESCELDTDRLELRRAGVLRPIEPQVFDLLRHLALNGDRVVSRDELLDVVWHGRIVSEATLGSRIKAARQAIGDDGAAQRLIRTLHGRGFRFLAAVTRRDGPQPAAERPAHAAGAATPRPAPCGREGCRQQLEALQVATEGGSGRLVVIAGEAGIGKSTLLASFAAGLAARRMPYAIGQCVEQQEASEPYLPFLDALGRLARTSEAATLAGLLERWAPTWLVHLPWAMDAAREERLRLRTLGATPERMLRELADLLEALAAEAPLVLVLEDLHWADRATLEAVRFLARRGPPPRLLLVTTLRTDAADGARQAPRLIAEELAVRGLVTLLRLDPLSAEEGAALVAGELGGGELASALVAALHRRAGGNPLLMHGLVAWWRERGLLVREDGRWRCPRGEVALWAGAPAGIRAMVEQQLGALAAGERAVVEAASLAGARFGAALVAAGLGQDPDAVEAACAGLAGRALLLREDGEERWPDGTVSTAFAFRHDLYRQAVEEQLPRGVRARLHHSFGTRLEQALGARAEERVAELAAHFLAAGEAERALRYLHAAARQALARGAHADAAAILRRALAVLQPGGAVADGERWEMRLQAALAPALVATQGWASAEAERAYLRALELGQALDAVDDVVAALYGLATLYELRGDYARTQALLLRRTLLGRPDRAARVEGEELMACSTFHQGRFAAAIEHAEQGLAFYEPRDHRALTAFLGENPAVSCHGWAARSLWFQGFPDRARDRAHAAIELAEASGCRFALASSHEQAGCLYQHRREPERTLEHGLGAIALGREHGYPYRVAVGRILCGWVAVVHRGEAGGLDEIAHGLVTCRDMGAAIDLPYFQAVHAEALLAAGQEEGALVQLDEALVRCALSRGFFWEAELHRLRGLALLGRGAGGASDAALALASATARRQGARLLELRAVLTRARLGGPGHLRRELATLLAGFDEGGDTPDLQEARALLDAP